MGAMRPKANTADHGDGYVNVARFEPNIGTASSVFFRQSSV